MDNTEHSDNNKHGIETKHTAMKKGGYYSLSTAGAKDVIDAASEMLLQALDAVLAADTANGHTERVFTLADMGCADGGTSLALVHRLITRLRQHNPQRPICLVYEDQPSNDYNALFNNIVAVQENNTALTTFPELYYYAAPVSFYQPILPSGQLHFAYSATAMHWLRSKPCEISNHIQAVGAQGAEKQAFAEQGRKDWAHLLRCRAKELAPNGRLVLINFCRDEQERYLGNTGGVNMFDLFTKLWQGFVENDIIEADEFTRMTLPQYYRTVKECQAPFAEPEGVAYQAGLRLEKITTKVIKCPYAVRFQAGEWDASQFATAYIPTLRSWTESTFFSALSEQRSLEARQVIIDQYYDAYHAEVVKNPEQHSMDYVHAYMVICKQ